MDLEHLRQLVIPAETKIVCLIMDGLGGLPRQPGGPTELESAHTPNLDRLAAEGICGLHLPVGSGITSGSGPAHQAIFGYDPLKYQVGRGALSAMGADFDLRPGDVAARGNFCTVDENGLILDRRAGRIPTELNQELVKLLQPIELPGVELFVQTLRDYRFLFVLRGPGLSGQVSDTDPQIVGVPPKPAQALDPAAERTAGLVQSFVEQAAGRLKDRQPANMILLRGFAMRPDWPSLGDIYGVRAAAIAPYPMYRGLARLVGMQVLPTGQTFEDEFATLAENWDSYDFFFVHIKPTDSYAEDGNFDKKAETIEAVDALIPRLRKLQPDVILVTGDHTTGAALQMHSWHPVPALIWSPVCRPDPVHQFGERPCLAGALGPRLPAVELMPVVMANAFRLKKFGA